MHLRLLAFFTACLWLNPAAAEICSDSEIADAQHPCKKWLTADYTTALETMGAAEVHPEFRGQGTTVVQFENHIPWVAALDGGSSEPLFGECTFMQSRAGDMEGFAPGGESCRVKWVQCFGISPFDGSKCSFKPGPAQTHATNVAQGILAVAPDTRLISLQLSPFIGPNFALAVDWLLEPNEAFDGKSPAEHWNVVAVNASYTLFAGRAPDDPDVNVNTVFAEQCELSNPNPDAGTRPEKYLDDWMLAHIGRVKLEAARGFKSHSEKLIEAGIMPVFVSHNYLGRQKTKDANGKSVTKRFITSNGLAFPACLGDGIAVSAVAPDYFKRKNKWRYIASNSHRELTGIVAPGGAASFAAPLVSGAVAVLRSANLQPGANPEQLLTWLQESGLPPAKAGISCIPVQDKFPAGEAPALGCVDLPYSLPVLDLKTAVEAATRD